jgi:hypothetical protein
VGSPGRSFLLILVAAAVVRAGVALWLGLHGPVVGDERGYVLLAESLAAGDGFRLPVPADVLAAAGVPGDSPLRAFRGPLVPLSLAPLSLLGAGLTAMRVMTLLVGAVGAALLYLASRRLVGERAACAAGLVYALWPPHVFVSVHVLSEPLSTALLLVAVMLAGHARGEGGGRAAALAGFVVGLSVLARPAVLLPAVLLAPATGGRRRAALLLLGLAAALAPWGVRNQVLLGSPALTTNSGVTLVGANSAAAATATPLGKWLPPDEVYARSEDPPDLGMWGWSRHGEVASNRRFASDALTWIRTHPGDAAKLAVWKVARLFDPDPRSRKPDAGRKALIGWLTLTPVLLLAVAGAASLRRSPSGWQPWLALVAGTVLTAVVFYGDTRMRTAADPTLLLLAAHGAGRLVPRSSPPASRSG